MNFIEFIGFVIAMLAFFFLMVKQARDDRKRRLESSDDVEDTIEGQEDEVIDLLQTLGIQPPKPKIVKPPPLQPNDELPVILQNIAQKRQTKPHKNQYLRNFETKQEKLSKSKSILKQLPSLKNAILLKEIFDSPKHSNEWHDRF